MAIHGMSAEDKFAASSSEILNRFGVRLTMGYDFDEYRHWVNQARPDHVVGDPFDNKQHKLGKGNACWIIGRDETGKIMHTQALRILPTGVKSVGEYFRSSFRGFAPSRPDIDYDRSRYRPGPGAKRMSGRVAYSGETWVGGSPGQYRGSGLSTVLGRYALLSAIKEFNVDYVVGFMIKPVAYKGFCLRMGFMHAEPMALRWYIQNEDEPVEAVMVYMSNEDIRFILDLPAAELDALAA